MEILTILCILSLNYITLDAYERVARAAICPKINPDDFPGGRVKYRRKGTRAAFRCPKRFNRYGPRFATCQSDGTWSNPPPLCTKTGCVPLDPSQVTNLDMEVVNGAVVKFSCLENYILIGATQAYCNGKDWSAPLPRCAAPHELTECDFEDDLCGWTQDDNEEQDWQRNVGATQTGNTGPKHDHTLGDTGNGHYLYFETSNPTMTGHQANLLSPVYTEDLSPMCFDFWYHILGPDEKGHVGSLEVYVLDQSQYIDDDDVHPLFYIDGNQGDQWHRGEIPIEKQDEPYQIAIVATRALSYISDIAIDDVRLHNCTKSTTSPPVSSPQSSPKPTTSSESSTQTTTVVTQKTETISPTTIKTETTVTTKTPTGTTVKKETTESPTPQVTKASASANTQPVNMTAETTTVVKVSTTSDRTPVVASSTKEESTSKVTTERQTSQSTPKPSYTQTTIKRTSTTQPLLKTTTKERTTEETTEKMKTSRPSSASSTSTTVSSTTTIHTTSSAKSTTLPPTTSTTETSTTTSFQTSTSTPSKEQTSTTKTSSKATSGSSSTSQQTSTVSTTLGKSFSTTTSTTSSTTRSSSSSTTTTFSSSSRTTSAGSSRSFSTSSSSRCTSTSSSSTTKTDKDKTVETKQPTTMKPDGTTFKETTDTNTESTDRYTSINTDKTVKSTKRTNMITTKSTDKSNNSSKDNTIPVSDGRSQHPEDDTLKPLMIGLCVGIVAGLIIIGVIAYVCVRRRKFYTSRHEDELKPITNSASLQSLNNGHYYQDEEYESES